MTSKVVIITNINILNKKEKKIQTGILHTHNGHPNHFFFIFHHLILTLDTSLDITRIIIIIIIKINEYEEKENKEKKKHNNQTNYHNKSS